MLFLFYIFSFVLSISPCLCFFGGGGVFVAAWKLSLVAARGASPSCGVQASHCGGHVGSVVVAHRLSCHPECGILLDQGSNPRTLYWQVDS